MTSPTSSEGSSRRSAGTSEAEFPLPDVEIPISRRLAPPSQIAPDCDIPVPTTEYIDPAYRLRIFLTQRPITTPTPSSSSSGTPEPSETPDRAREQSPSPSRGPSLSESRSSRLSPSVYPNSTPSSSDGEPEIKREPSEGDIWGASPGPIPFGVPRLPAPTSPVHRSDAPTPTSPVRRSDKPAPSRSPSGSGVGNSTGSGSKRSRATADDGADDLASQRRRIDSPSALAHTSPSIPLPTFRTLVEPRTIFEPARAAALGALERLNSRVSIADLTGHARSVSIVSVRPVLPAVAVSAQPAGLVVVEPVNIFDIAPVASGAGPVLHPVPVVDRAQGRIQSRLNALFARSQNLPRGGRAAMYRSFESLLGREEQIMDLQLG